MEQRREKIREKEEEEERREEQKVRKSSFLYGNYDFGMDFCTLV